MDTVGSGARPEVRLALWGRAAVGVVLVFAVLNAAGWTIGTGQLNRVFPSWPRATPWGALWLGTLGAAILAQSGHPSRLRVWVGRGLAAAVGLLAIVVLAEHLSPSSFGSDGVWFGNEAGPTRPSPRTASSVLYLSVAVVLMRFDRRRTGLLWGMFLIATVATPLVTVMGHMFRAISAVQLPESTGQEIATAIGVLLLVAATLAARPDRNPLAWLLARPDRWALLRLVGVLGGLPVLIGLARLPFLAFGLGSEAAWILATTIATIIVGVIALYLSQREQKLLIEKEQLSRQRADAEMRYRILADNAVDVIFHLHGSNVTWVSPSVEAAFGEPPGRWVGSDVTHRVHPDDLDTLLTAMQGAAADRPVLARFRVRTTDGGHHWVDGHVKPYLDADGTTDGLIAALRIVDEQVEAQQRLDRLARFDTLTGLPNRAEAIARLESALHDPRDPGVHLGVLFCDVDYFKSINDTWGHSAGDVVLATIAARIRDSIRQGDTVGRIGGDEMVVLLPGIHDLDEAVEIGEKIRCRIAEPIQHGGNTIRATLSIGATISVPGESAAAVTARADVAMYRAKQASRNMVVRI